MRTVKPQSAKQGDMPRNVRTARTSCSKSAQATAKCRCARLEIFESARQHDFVFCEIRAEGILGEETAASMHRKDTFELYGGIHPESIGNSIARGDLTCRLCPRQ